MSHTLRQNPNLLDPAIDRWENDGGAVWALPREPSTARPPLKPASMNCLACERRS